MTPIRKETIACIALLKKDIRLHLRMLNHLTKEHEPDEPDLPELDHKMEIDRLKELIAKRMSQISNLENALSELESAA